MRHHLEDRVIFNGRKTVFHGLKFLVMARSNADQAIHAS